MTPIKKRRLTPTDPTNSLESTEKESSYLAILTYDNAAVYAEQDEISKLTQTADLEYQHRSRDHKFLHSVFMELIDRDDGEKKGILMKLFPDVRQVKEDMVRSMLANDVYDKGTRITDRSTKAALFNMHVLNVRAVEIVDGDAFQEFITSGPIDWYMSKESDVSGGLSISNNRLRYVIPGCKTVATLWDMTDGGSHDTN